ncbi:Protein INX-3 [Aphelenchoides avenae]|nr:Protein INX-3 [Aphelenchus avenae]
MIEIPFLKDFLGRLKTARLDDLVDRLNYRFTSILLVLCATVVGTKQIFGHPIACMVDAEFPGQWVNYVHDYCFVSGTYHAPRHDGLGHEPKGIEINYYQWTPYLLALQALFCYVPHFLWTSLVESADLDLRNTVEQATKIRGLTSDKRKTEVENIAKYLMQIVDYRCGGGSRGLGHWCAIAYLISKMLSVSNLILQLHLLSITVGYGRGDWALTIIGSAMNGNYWPQTGLFPRTSFCVFETHSLGSVQKRTAQCALMINMLNEKVFVLVYVWLALLVVPTVLNLVYSAMIVLVSFLRLWFVRRYIEPMGNLRYSSVSRFGHYEKDLRVKTFAFQVLGMDGFLLLRFVQAHAGHLVASEVARGLFKQWEEEHSQSRYQTKHGMENFTICSELNGTEHSLNKGFSSATTESLS